MSSRWSMHPIRNPRAWSVYVVRACSRFAASPALHCDGRDGARVCTMRHIACVLKHTIRRVGGCSPRTRDGPQTHRHREGRTPMRYAPEESTRCCRRQMVDTAETHYLAPRVNDLANSASLAIVARRRANVKSGVTCDVRALFTWGHPCPSYEIPMSVPRETGRNLRGPRAQSHDSPAARDPSRT
jgi:hypothetical protein